ncbi:MAG: hypothetical protein M0Q90_06835 [Bacteroidales bacterium]|nr:hypothetical protein [Bacteroidales bacterium]
MNCFLSTDYADYTDFIEVVVGGGDELVGIEKCGFNEIRFMGRCWQG